MADEQQALYELYTKTYGKPKQAKHLVAFSKKQRQSLKFSEAKRLLLDNMNLDKDKDIDIKKKKAKPQPKTKPLPKGKTNIKIAKKMKNNATNGTKPPQSKAKPKIKHKTKPKETKKVKKKSGFGTDPNALFGSLSGAIKPLSSIKPIEVIQKTSSEIESESSNGHTDSDRKTDEENERKYKTMKSSKNQVKTKGRKFEKKKGTGSTPKPIAIDTSSPKAEDANKKKKKKKKKKKEPKLRRKLTPIPPPSGKGSVLSLASKFEKEGKKSKRNSSKKTFSKKQSNKKSKKSATKRRSTKKVKMKWNRDVERDVCSWFNEVMAQQILKLNGGKGYLRGILSNGQLLCRLINKLCDASHPMIDARVIKQKANIVRYDVERMESFMRCCGELGVASEDMFCEDALRSGASENVMSILHTLGCLKKEIESRSSSSPLAVWCSYNSISSDICDKLCAAEYDLRRLFSLKSDEIENTINSLSLNNKLSLMKCIVELKQSNSAYHETEWIVLKDDIYCNLASKQILNVNVVSDAQQLVPPFVEICASNHAFLLVLFEKYFDAQWFVDAIFSFVSRMKVGMDREAIKSDLCEQMRHDLSPIPIGELHSCDLNDIYCTKLSYNLMELLTSSNDSIIASFVDRYAEELIFHSLCVFVGDSCSAGNAYHARIILDFLLDKYCTHLLSAICGDATIALLFEYAICTQLAHGNLNSFVLELISFEARTEKESKLKKRVIDKFVSLQFVSYVVRVACGGNETYALFVTDLFARCAFDADSHRLFLNCKVPVFVLLLDAIISSKRSRANRIACAQTVCAMLDILKMPSLMVDQSNQQTNHLHSELFESSLRLICDKYFDKLSSIVVDKATSAAAIRINCGVIASPFGPLRFHCLQVIGITVELSKNDAGLRALSQSFWCALFDLCLLHSNNNFFLNEFRRLLHLVMLFGDFILEYLCLKCDLLHRFYVFYSSNVVRRTELHAFIIQMLWNFGSKSSDDDSSFNVCAHFESDSHAQEWNYFVRIIEDEMQSRVLTQDIDLEIQSPIEEEEEEEEEQIMDENMNNDDIFNWNPFREEILQQNAMPNAEYLSHFGLFRDYSFDIPSSSSSAAQVISVSHSFAHDDDDDYVMFFWNMNSQIVQRELSATRDALNLMIVLDHSYRMSHSFVDLNNKMEVTSHVLGVELVKLLDGDEDQIGLISFDHEAYLEFDLTHNFQSDLVNCINAMSQRLSSEGSALDMAYYRACESFEDISAANKRILLITTREPSALVELLSRSSSCNIGTTFVSLSREFSLTNQSQIAECAGCNYFHIQSRHEFVVACTTDAAFNLYQPIFFDVELYCQHDDESRSSPIDTIYGGMMNDDERQYRCKTGNLESHKTLFSNCCDEQYRYNLNQNNVKLIKINPTKNKAIKISIHIQEHQIYEYTIKNIAKCGQQQQHYDNDTIKKVVLLTKYLNLVKEWRQQNDDDDEKCLLNVDEKYKVQFEKLLRIFEKEDDLQKEVAVLQKLAHFDLEEAQIIRDLAKFDH